MYKTLIKVVSKLFGFLGGVVVTLVVVAAIAIPWALSKMDATADISQDVSLRLASPDYKRLAFLVSSDSGSERYIIVEMLTPNISTTKYESIPEKCKKRIFRSQAYDSDLRIDLHEKIEWSSDSSLLVLTVDAQPRPFQGKPGADPVPRQPFKWAYDFQADQEVVIPDRIEALWQERNHIATKD